MITSARMMKLMMTPDARRGGGGQRTSAHPTAFSYLLEAAPHEAAIPADDLAMDWHRLHSSDDGVGDASCVHVGEAKWVRPPLSPGPGRMDSVISVSPPTFLRPEAINTQHLTRGAERRRRAGAPVGPPISHHFWL